ncbi:MAG: T9SS type A sorting domain-containing protein [Saprospiraceae bacterium]
MKKLLFLFFAIINFFSLNFLHSQKYVYNKLYGGVGYDDIRSLVVNNNGEAIFTGLTKSGKDTAGNVYITKVDKLGNVIFHREYGRLNEDGGNGLLKTSDNGFLICGHTALPNVGEECDALVTKLDSNFNQEWQVTLGDSLDETCYQAVEMEDKSLWIVGVEHNELNNKRKGLIFHLKSDGNFLGADKLSAPQNNLFANRIYHSTDSNLLVSGIFPGNYLVNQNDPGGRSYTALNSFYAKIDPRIENNSNYLSFHSAWYADHSNNKQCGILELPLTNRIMVYGTHNNKYTGLDSIDIGQLWIDVYKSNGVKDASFDDPFVGSSVGGVIRDAALAEDGTIYLVGDFYDFNSSKYSAFYLVLNSDLLIEAWGAIPINYQASVNCIALGKNYDIFIGGRQWDSYGESQMLLVHVFPFSQPTATNSVTNNNVELYPNPCNQNVFIKFNNFNELKSIQLFNLEGKTVLSQQIKVGENSINTSSLEEGIYIYKCRLSNEKIVTGKLVIQKSY